MRIREVLSILLVATSAWALDFGSNVGAGASSTSGELEVIKGHPLAADRSATSTFLQHPGPVKGRRTATDIWPD